MRDCLLLAMALLLSGCFTKGTDHFAYPGDGIPMPDLRGRWVRFDEQGEMDSTFYAVIGDLPPTEPFWSPMGAGDSVLHTREGLYYRDGLSFTYWSGEYLNDDQGPVVYRPVPSMVLSFFRLGNDTFFETHLPEPYLQSPSRAQWLNDSLGLDITTTVLVNHHVGRVLRYRPDTIEYTWGWSNGQRLMRMAREQQLNVFFLDEGTYGSLLYGTTPDLRTLMEIAARTDTIESRFRFVRMGR